MAKWWDKCFPRSREDVSSKVGLALAGLYLTAAIGVGVAAFHVHRDELQRVQINDGQRWTYWLARHLGQAVDGTGALVREVRQVGREPDVEFCEVIDAQGKIIAHSNANRIGQTTEPLDAFNVGDADAPVRIIHPPGETRIVMFVARIPAAAGEPREVRLALTTPDLGWSQSGILFCTGYVLLAVLGIYFIVYRILQRSIQPLSVIRDRLVGCEDSLTDRLAALRLNDSYDEVSTSWNKLIGFVSEMQDELRRSQTAPQLTEAMDRYRSERLTELLMQIPLGILVVGEDRQISLANRAAGGMLGQNGEPLEGRPVGDVLPEDLQISVLSTSRAQRGTASSAGRWVDYTFERTGGSVTLRFWSSPGADGAHETVLVVQDVTQSKESERARDSFLDHVSHEFRTPLTNIRAYTETLSQGLVDDEQTVRECYNVVMSETSRLARLVEDLLNVSHLEVGTAKLNIQEVPLADLLRKVVQDNQGSADAKDIDLVLRLPAKAAKLPGDRDWLTVVFNNLVGNAIKYTPAGGRVEVRAAIDNGRAEIAVADTGMGIAPQDQEKVFDKFYRVSDERVSAVPGSGLGLSIARETVRAHGGSIGLVSTPGQGSTFTVSLQALEIDESAAGKKFAGPGLAEGQTPRKKPQTDETKS